MTDDFSETPEAPAETSEAPPEVDPLEDAVLEKIQALFAKSPPARSWSDYLSEEEQERIEKMARQRAARLTRVML